MNKSKIFILTGIIFLIIALILYFNNTEYVYNVTGPQSIALSAIFVRNLFITYFIGQTGVILLIFGIRDYEKK